MNAYYIFGFANCEFLIFFRQEMIGFFRHKYSVFIRY